MILYISYTIGRLEDRINPPPIGFSEENMKFIFIDKKRVLAGIAMLIALVCLSVTTQVTDSAKVYLGSTVRKLPVYSVETDQKVVALTFDAASGDSYTGSILATLAKEEATATFFLTGLFAEGHQDLVKRMSDAGLEIGSHSNTHPHMNKLNDTQMRLEIETSVKAIENITGKGIKIFRAPYGEYNDRLITVCQSMNIKPVQWDVDTQDWKNANAIEISGRVLQKAANGSIVLMHNDGKYTAAALPLMIAALKSKGFKFVTVSELIALAGEKATIDNTGRLRSA